MGVAIRIIGLLNYGIVAIKSPRIPDKIRCKSELQ